MASRKDAVCFKHFTEALAENPKAYGHIDILCGGWPCQDNSIAGSREFIDEVHTSAVDCAVKQENMPRNYFAKKAFLIYSDTKE